MEFRQGGPRLPPLECGMPPLECNLPCVSHAISHVARMQSPTSFSCNLARISQVGQAEFRVVGPCPRCTVPDVGQTSGVRDMAGSGPMSTLRGYRARAGKGVLFGIYLAPLNPGARVRVGDVVEAR